MGEIINHIFYIIQTITMILSFIFSLRLIKNSKKIISYMRGFYWYPVVGMLIVIPGVLSTYFDLSFSFSLTVNNILLIFHFTFLSLFIIKVMPRKKEIKYLKSIFWVFLLLIIYLLIKNDISTQVNHIFSVSNFGLSIFCIIYYFKLFNNLPTLNLRKDPAFWIVTGVFFAMALNIPICATIDFLKNKISYDAYLIFASILMFCYSIMHLFFIKAILCTMQMKQV